MPMADDDMRNWMELGLNAAEEKFVRETAELYRKVYITTIDTIFDFAKAIEILRKAHASSGIPGEYTAALVQYGFTARDGGPMNKAIRSHFKKLLDNEEKVRAWWAKVDARKKRDWLSAKAIYTHWQKSLKPPGAPPARHISDHLSPALTKKNQEIAQLRARIEEVEQERDAAKQDKVKPAGADVKWTYDSIVDLVERQPKKTQDAVAAELKRIKPELFKAGGKAAAAVESPQDPQIKEAIEYLGALVKKLSHKERTDIGVDACKALHVSTSQVVDRDHERAVARGEVEELRIPMPSSSGKVAPLPPKAKGKRKPVAQEESAAQPPRCTGRPTSQSPMDSTAITRRRPAAANTTSASASVILSVI
jgi:hypothetical protein